MSNSSTFSRWRPHPWHGIAVGTDLPRVVNAYIEITPFDQMKYEIDKDTGYLCIDRPQLTSAQQPTLYGFIPRTYCGNRVRDLMPGTECGDGDPLDICVISERAIDRSEIIIKARVLGGLPMNDGGEADDKIIAVIKDDPVYGHMNDISELPPTVVNRISHYFQTYKMVPGKTNKVSIGAAYGYEHAKVVLAAAMADYDEDYGDLIED